MGVAGGNRHHLRGHVFGQAVLKVHAIDVDDFGHADDLAGGLGCSFGTLAGDQHMHLATTLGSGGHGVEGRGFDGVVVVFGYYEYSKCGHVNSLDYFGFVPELVHQGGDIGNFHTGAALGRLADLQGLDARLDVHAEVFRLDVVELLFSWPS